jgi:hypothetical protein
VSPRPATPLPPGAFRRAEPLLRNALELMWRELRGPHPYTARCYAVLGAMLARAGKLQEAATQLQQAVEIMQVGRRLGGCFEAPLGPVRCIDLPSFPDSLLLYFKRVLGPLQSRFGLISGISSPNSPLETSGVGRGEQPRQHQRRRLQL